MKPFRRPFADWVEGRVLPYFEGRPWVFPMLWAGTAALSLLKFTFTHTSQRWAMVVNGLVWSGALVGVLWVLLKWADYRRERRIEELRENKICLHCGYDLRATPERCPECGMRPTDPVEV